MKKFKEYLYLEFLIPIKDYFIVLKSHECIFDWGIPLIFSTLSYFLCIKGLSLKNKIDFNGYVINFLAILIGFSITCITILFTSDSENVKQLRNSDTERKIGNKKINLFQLIFITFSFVLIMEFLTLVSILIYDLIYISEERHRFSSLFFVANILLLSNIIALNIRNISNFYFIFRKES